MANLESLTLYEMAGFFSNLQAIAKTRPEIKLADALSELSATRREHENQEAFTDFDNVVTHPKRLSDNKLRVIMPPLMENIKNQKKLEREKPELFTMERAYSELDSLLMKHLHYNSDILQVCLLEIFKRLSLICKFSLSIGKLGNFISACLG
jgi:hypothetical protein